MCHMWKGVAKVAGVKTGVWYMCGKWMRFLRLTNYRCAYMVRCGIR